MAELAGTALSEFFYRTDTDPPDGPEGGYRNGRPVAGVLNDAGAGYIATPDIIQVLAERHATELDGNGSEKEPFNDKARYARKESVNAWDFEGYWFDFERGLKTETRYFNRAAEATLALMFDGIDAHRTIDGRPIIVEAGPGTDLARLYRARMSRLVLPPHRSQAPAA